MHRIAVMDHTGDTEILFNPESAEEVSAARARFNALTDRNHLAFRTDTQPPEQIRSFDQDVQEVVMVPHIQGG